MKIGLTPRGFKIARFTDSYGAECSLQESSAAFEAKIWLGLDDANPQILHGDAKALGIETDATCGWIPYPIPACVNLNTRMHLNQKQAAALIPLLQHFVKHGVIPDTDN